jgi:hypothetical protein
MAMGCRVLATPAAVRGIDTAPPPGVTVADATPAMIAAAQALFAEEAGVAARLGNDARDYVRRHFSWDSHLATLLQLVDGEARPSRRADAAVP